MVNDATIALIKEFEGLRLEAYPDPGSKNGLPATIGYGHTKGVKLGDKISVAQAEAFLKEDIANTEAIIAKYVKVPLNENQHGAIVSFVYNINENLFAKSSVLKFINQGKLDSVPGRMALYRLNDGKVMAGLVRRRTAEGALWMKPVNVGTDSVSQGSNTPAKPDTPKKPWDWGAAGALVTLIAGISGNVKQIIGNFTSAFGVDPLWVLLAAGLGFAGWTIYSKWKEH